MLGLSGPGPPPPPPPPYYLQPLGLSMVPGPSQQQNPHIVMGASSAPSTSFTNHLGPTAAPSSDTLLLQLRQKPNSRVFRALFQYLPLRDSPNENPQLELSLQPGDVILVKGEMDSDGFYRGETLDGRQGLVPSNYVERVPDTVLLANARAPSPSFPLRIPPHLSTIAHDFSSPDHSTLPDSVCPYPPADVTKVTVQEIKSNETPRVPCPRELIVEKKLSRSALVSWSPPEESFVAVSQYHVCVDGAVRAIVPGTYKCRALVEDIPLESSVNLSVRAVTEHGHSPDACCTIAIGNEAQVAPQQVRVWAVTPVSACIRWYPSNSNAEHVVSLNAVKVGVCPPTVFQVQLQGLQPSTIYRVSVRTKHPKAVLEQRPVERCTDFKTLPKIGLPDPPSHVQVEIGPQPGTLLVSWQPVANQPKPPSRAAVHSYLIYADGKNIAQVPQATADHVVLRLSDLSDDPPIFITVRTKTKEGAVSSDSNVARVPRTQASGVATQSLPAGPPTIDPLTLVDMTSSYPSYPPPPQHNPLVANSMYVPLGSAGTLTNGHVAPPPSSAVAPFTAPARMVGATGLMTYQQPSYPSVQQQQQSSAPGGYATFDRSASLGAQPQSAAAAAAAASILLGAPTQRPSSGGHTTWKQPSQMSQYYTFHPNFLHTEPSGADEPRPSVLEMENSYLMRHRQAADWANAPESRDARARIEAYSRGLARAGSADERMHHGSVSTILRQQQQQQQQQRLVAPRSEPDLRPPTLDSDDCRHFVALFDYTAAMSPNPNAEFEELQFRKHQLIKVYGGQDPDGFFHGVIGNRAGLVPSNMVIEIAKEDVSQRRPTTMPAPPPPTAPEPALRRQRWGSLKSRSYDYAGDRSVPHRPHPNYVSLDRRDERDRLPEGRYRRGGGAVSSRPDYEYRRLPADKEYDGVQYRRRQPIVDPRDRDDYEDDYRDKYRDPRDLRDPREPREPRDIRDPRDRYDRDPRERDRRYPSEDRRRPEDRYPPREPYDPYREKYRERPRMDEPAPFRDDRTTYDYPPTQARYEANQMGPGPQPGPMSQMNHQMSQMSMQQQQQQQPLGIPSSSGIGGMGGAGIGGMQQQQQQQTADAQMYPNGVGTMKQLVAKFDYNPRQLSPNVDAEQVELTFRQGDRIIVYGEMDDDGFYMGELNGQHGLVPSNFLQASPLTNLAPSQPPGPMRKEVAFSDAAVVRKTAPVRQPSQTSNAPGATMASVTAAAAAGAVKPVAKKASAGATAGKALAKKTSDVGKSSTPNARKTSTAVKKSDTGAKPKK
ncbi:unnamed protein product [Caenorhabditis sp. 36 PRJEB53466]|nr:unnamed protein product [Caenorhabditis sp. 36 PRJEB53466]